ncbi:DUF1456 family protein [uncultured Shewanella sp.]|uniref:DUF1456 family protein n=1 Tax=uncultured Shewanella sp. TaxID=173975 RepID=UPI00261AEEEE|nr:DUF1456 family protein [uncultured Shewanella sp.]
MIETIPTNDVFKNLITILRIHKDREYIIDLFARQNITVTNAKLKSWIVKSGKFNKDFRPMPREALEAFFRALHDAKIVDMNDSE